MHILDTMNTLLLMITAHNALLTGGNQLRKDLWASSCIKEGGISEYLNPHSPLLNAHNFLVLQRTFHRKHKFNQRSLSPRLDISTYNHVQDDSCHLWMYLLLLQQLVSHIPLISTSQRIEIGIKLTIFAQCFVLLLRKLLLEIKKNSARSSPTNVPIVSLKASP